MPPSDDAADQPPGKMAAAMESHIACQLLATSFAWYLQAFLGLVCFASLVGKRFTDKVRRPWKVWFLDTSKQGFSAFLVHFLNILLSMGFERFLDSEADPCNWYWINLTLDDTLGIGVCFLLLKCMQCAYRSRCIDRPELALSGEYGDPPSCRIWARQLLDWQLLVMVQKSIFCAFVIKFTPSVAAVAEFLLGWLDPYPKVKLVVVMVITPLTMNMFALWMADSFLQAGSHARADEEHISLRDTTDQEPARLRRGQEPRSSRDDDDGDSLVGFEEWKSRLSSQPKPTRWGKQTRSWLEV
mmetsp:Transcript_87233/g.182562  ORF Transcript_87233/g.182562 Transcript_87233/m.182562 type:complete len:299 (+) Transcript_87233:132-1028(+)|eukprot:CAMPEP_0206427058 /NCGR_PEP_ID=MMETSP0324_2-20121206/4787_1 /ASSEMBLY_ACC=CAM_ASM_000836 /TAXON_ID=2866 /ORGANISM="Crypthecodinium cohnii, Strain Seligo" /LENGTH=298 /DNA_ID=CAMNT_0053892211 /DNA_START=67 /DNA_END=963 /DNA_ORIENTATION=-